jgi:hypothetical protein
VNTGSVAQIRKWIRFGGIVWASLSHEGLGFLTLWRRAARRIPGWLTGPDARLLYALAHHGPGSGAIVEIGSAWGLSTVFLAAGSKRARRERVYAIDPHTGDPWYLQGIAPPRGGVVTPAGEHSVFSSQQQFEATLRVFGVDDWVYSVVRTSEEAARMVDTGPVRLLFVDGLHTYEGASTDFASWVPRVVRDGIIVFDDYFNRNPGVGVKRAVDELLASGTVEPRLYHEGGYFTWTRRL